MSARIGVALAAMAMIAPVARGQTCRVSGRIAPAAFIEVAASGKADTNMAVHVCLVPSTAGIGSYTAVVSFDPSLRPIRTETTGGLQAASAVQGVVRLSGAAPGGFPAGEVATIQLGHLHAAVTPRLRLTLTELHSPSGDDLLGNVAVTGYPATDAGLGKTTNQSAGSIGALEDTAERGAVPRVDSISPRSATIDRDGVLGLVIYGRDFASNGNVVLFDGTEIDGVLSEQDGRVLRFQAPGAVRARGTGAPERIQAGTHDIRVRSRGKTSNAVTLTLREEPR